MMNALTTKINATDFVKRFLLLAVLVLAWAGMGAARAQMTITPLGDSITAGGGVGLPTNQSGYRDQLFTDLNSENISFKFEGTQNNYASPQLIAAGDQYHDGIGGISLGSIYSNITAGNYGTSVISPNVVLLLGGINDVQYGENAATIEANMTNILNWFHTNDPRTIMLVGETMPYDVTSNTSMAAYNATINQFDSWLVTNVPTYGANDHVVDTYDTFISGGAINSSLFADGLHPTVTGYADLGNDWNAAVEAYVVPEPSSLGLLLVGLVGCAYACRCRVLSRISRGGVAPSAH